LRDSDSPGVKAFWSCYAENSLLARLVESVLCLAFCDKLNWRIDARAATSMARAGVNFPSRSGSRVLISWSSQPCPSALGTINVGDGQYYHFEFHIHSYNSFTFVA